MERCSRNPTPIQAFAIPGLFHIKHILYEWAFITKYFVQPLPSDVERLMCKLSITFCWHRGLVIRPRHSILPLSPWLQQLFSLKPIVSSIASIVALYSFRLVNSRSPVRIFGPFLVNQSPFLAWRWSRRGHYFSACDALNDRLFPPSAIHPPLCERHQFALWRWRFSSTVLTLGLFGVYVLIVDQQVMHARGHKMDDHRELFQGMFVLVKCSSLTYMWSLNLLCHIYN